MEPFSTPTLHYPSESSEYVVESLVSDIESLRLPSPLIREESPHPSMLRPRRQTSRSPTFRDYVSLPSISAFTHLSETPESYQHSNGGTEIVHDLPEVPEPAHSGPPFFQVTDIPRHPPFTIEVNGEQRALPYVSYREANGHVFQVGTEGTS